MERVSEARTETNQRFATTRFGKTYHELSRDFTEANPGGINLTAVSKEISERWNSLSKEDRIAITAGSVQEIEEEREAKDLASHNVPLAAFHDTRSTLQDIEKQVNDAPYLWWQINQLLIIDYRLTPADSAPCANGARISCHR